jgi:hypothetical protein
VQPKIVVNCIYSCSILPAFQEEGLVFITRQIFEGLLLLSDSPALSMLMILQF